MPFLLYTPIEFINGLTPRMAQFIIFCATTLGTLIILGTVVYLLVRRLPFTNALSPLAHVMQRGKDLFILAFTSLGAYIISVALKNHFMLGRPITYNLDLKPLLTLADYGFPSSHAMTFSAFAMAVYFINKRAGVIIWLLSLIVLLGRIYTGVHSPMDIITGALLGILFAVLVNVVVRLVNKTRSK